MSGAPAKDATCWSGSIRRLPCVSVCKAVAEAINAGVDLLLVAYDGAQFYRVFACARQLSE
ncbi:hypothetical protein EAV90_03790 [Bradyrhizobium vignae]|nr:hypothetical protein EAV90_03790 [Bradyrhizobium vignae]